MHPWGEGGEDFESFSYFMDYLPPNLLLNILIQIISIIFQNFEILSPVQAGESENIENALKYEVFKMILES